MAVAKKCDICRKLYEEYNVKQSKDNFNGFVVQCCPDGEEEC